MFVCKLEASAKLNVNKTRFFTFLEALSSLHLRHNVTQFVEALRHKPQDRTFYSLRYNRNSSLT